MKYSTASKDYIKKRKRKAANIRLLFRLFQIFPLKQKIVFTAFEGDGGYCCNPRYIAEELHRQGQGYEMVWLVNNLDKQMPAHIKKVKNTRLNRTYHLSTARIWVDNSRKELGTVKRKNQLYIQTWHAAIEFKPVGGFRGALFPEIAEYVSRQDSNLIDYVTSNSKWCTDRYPTMLLYDGEIIKTGSPRCDVFHGEREATRYRIRERYSIAQEAKIVLFAPTFRGGSQSTDRSINPEATTLKLEELAGVLARRFGGEWHVLLRLHPQLAARMAGFPEYENTLSLHDVSQADDMNELLAASDVLVTDYSSSAFDAMIMEIPVFLYVDDFKEYTVERGQLMWDLNALPFPYGKTNGELQEKIITFEQDRYQEAIRLFLQEHEVCEDGHASERVVEYIHQFINQ
ncbi:MAG: CDP-glycerol glycerophosphotransferase family protein [Lachnospiraceae bacterium]